MTFENMLLVNQSPFSCLRLRCKCMVDKIATVSLLVHCSTSTNVYLTVSLPAVKFVWQFRFQYSTTALSFGGSHFVCLIAWLQWQQLTYRMHRYQYLSPPPYEVVQPERTFTLDKYGAASSRVSSAGEMLPSSTQSV
jgi:hypothetical protein